MKVIKFISPVIFFLIPFSISSILFPQIVLGADHTYYIHSDPLGSVIAVTDDSGNSVQQLAYAPYGKEAASAQASASQGNQQITERGYTGQIKDNNTSLSYYNARYYDAVLSRFISADSVQGGNRYSYVGGNPISKSDPTGNRIYEDDVDSKKKDIVSTQNPIPVPNQNTTSTTPNFGQVRLTLPTRGSSNLSRASMPITDQNAKNSNNYMYDITSQTWKPKGSTPNALDLTSCHNSWVQCTPKSRIDADRRNNPIFKSLVGVAGIPGNIVSAIDRNGSFLLSHRGNSIEDFVAVLDLVSLGFFKDAGLAFQDQGEKHAIYNATHQNESYLENAVNTAGYGVDAGVKITFAATSFVGVGDFLGVGVEHTGFSNAFEIPGVVNANDMAVATTYNSVAPVK